MDNFLAWMNLFLVLSLFGMLATLGKKLDILQRRVDAIATHLNIQPIAVVPPEVLGLLQAGRKIEAIKVYRKATGAGLAEAKEAVEQMERDAASPGRIIRA